MVSRFYAYILVDPRNGIPFYIGKGTNNRHRQHVVEVAQGLKYTANNPRKKAWVRDILDHGYEDVLYDIHPCDSEQHAFDTEERLILEFGLENLTNITPGGDQGPYQGKAVDQYNLYGELIRTWNSALEAANFYGHNYSTTISRACLNYKRSKRPFGYIWSYQGIKPDFEHIWKTVKPVYQFSIDGKYINRFPSAIEAARQVLNNSRRSYEIRQAANKGWVCKGNRWSNTPQLSF